MLRQLLRVSQRLLSPLTFWRERTPPLHGNILTRIIWQVDAKDLIRLNINAMVSWITAMWATQSSLVHFCIRRRQRSSPLVYVTPGFGIALANTMEEERSRKEGMALARRAETRLANARTSFTVASSLEPGEALHK